MNIVVTGGCGFIGTNFIRYILKKYPSYKIFNIDKLTYAGVRANLKEFEGSARYSFFKYDICSRKKTAPVTKKADIIVHFAAETHVDRSIADASAFVKTDVVGAYVMLEEALKNKRLKKFIHISTDEVYGDAYDPIRKKSRPSMEYDPLMPMSPYAASKAGADRLAYSYYTTYGLPVVITRCSNNFGPYQYPEKIIPLFVTNALDNKPLPVYGTGKNTRDWIYVDDHCRAIDLIMHTKKNVEGKVFNVGGGVEKSSGQIADLICDILNKPKSLIKKVKDRKGHVMRHAVNIEKIKKELGFKPKGEFDKLIKDTVEWYVKNKDWWKKNSDSRDGGSKRPKLS